MGGPGSGRRPNYSGKRATDDSQPLDIRRLQRAGVLAPGRFATWQWTVSGSVRASISIRAEIGSISLAYNHTAHGRAAEAINQTIWLETTPCTLGGHRRWFACPACGRRVALIYGAGRLFACRQCKDLAYAGQRESADDRALRRADRIRKQLGWPAGVAHGHGSKPAGMHRATFDRLRLRHDSLVNLWALGTAKWLRMVR